MNVLGNSDQRVLAIVGSVRPRSFTRALVASVAEGFRGQGVEVDIWDLREQPLPIADPTLHREPGSHPDEVVRSFVNAAESCAGMLWASPVYHNSYSGVLKNALDTIAIPQVAYKPVGLLSHGGNRSTQPVDHLRIVARGILGVAVPTQVCTAPEDFDVDGSLGPMRVSAEPILGRIHRFTSEFVLFSTWLATIRQTMTVR